MTDSVVSSHYGNRPLLQVPALQVSNHGSLAVPSLQIPSTLPNPETSFPQVPNVTSGLNDYNQCHHLYPPDSWQQNRIRLPGLIRNHSAPPGMLYSSQNPYYRREEVYPLPSYAPRRPEMMDNFARHDYVPRQLPARVLHPSYGLSNPDYNVTCHLEFGRIVNIDLRGCFGEFRGVPSFLRSELMRAYGSYPYIKVKVRMEGEEFHIFAIHDNRHRRHRLKQRGKDSDSESDMQLDDDYEEEDRYFTHYGRRSESEGRRRVRNRDYRVRPRGMIVD